LKDVLEGKKIPNLVDTGVDIITPQKAKQLLTGQRFGVRKGMRVRKPRNG
jgi:hypothetical protein